MLLNDSMHCKEQQRMTEPSGTPIDTDERYPRWPKKGQISKYEWVKLLKKYDKLVLNK